MECKFQKIGTFADVAGLSSKNWNSGSKMYLLLTINNLLCPTLILRNLWQSLASLNSLTDNMFTYGVVFILYAAR